MTISSIQPKSQHEPIDMRIPYGTARVAFAASSDMWTLQRDSQRCCLSSKPGSLLDSYQLSKPPIVHIADNHEINQFQPVGQVVKFSE